MGKKFIIYVLFLLLVLYLGNANAQAHQQGEAVLTIGVGNSLIGTIFDIVTSASGTEGSSSPVINVMVDYGMIDMISLGVAFSNQQYRIEFDDSSGDFVDKIRCLNFGLRPLLHFYNSDNLDLYGGFRISYTRWSATSTNTVAGYDPLEPYSLSSVGFQPLGGVSYYFTDWAGLNMEVGLGGVYIFAVGARLRLTQDMYLGSSF